MIGTADRAIWPAELLAMDRAHITMAPPHLPMITNPGLVTALILMAVQAAT